MTLDVLHHWLTHLREGSWNQFRKAVEELAPSDTDTSLLCRTLRLRLSELGHVDFFLEGSQTWRVRSPVLGGLQNSPGVAVLCGGRTPKLISALENAAKKSHCQLNLGSIAEGISIIELEGTEETIATAAIDTGVLYIPDCAALLCQSLIPIIKQLEVATEAFAPANWTVRSFDLQSKRWVEGLLPCTAYEYTTRYQVRRYFVCLQKGKLVEMPKREAVYAAAALRGVSLAAYNWNNRTLSTPTSAPFPEMYARIACLSSGRPSRIEQEYLVYDDIAPDLAAFLLVAAGQPHPGIRWVKNRD